MTRQTPLVTKSPQWERHYYRSLKYYHTARAYAGLQKYVVGVALISVVLHLLPLSAVSHEVVTIISWCNCAGAIAFFIGDLVSIRIALREMSEAERLLREERAREKKSNA